MGGIFFDGELCCRKESGRPMAIISNSSLIEKYGMCAARMRRETHVAYFPGSLVVVVEDSKMAAA